MLTIQNNLKNTNLETLSKRLIKDDYHNFRLSVVGGGFTEGIADRIISRLTSNEDAKIVIVNDITLQMICKLLSAGYKLENITLAFGKWNSNGTVSKDNAVYNIMKSFIKANVKETINLINLEELFGMKFDLIIANPPYGKVGAQITKKIVDEVNFNEFINLLPIKDMPSVGLEACSHIDMPETIVCPPHSFSDADILTHILRITKTPNKTYATFEELCADSYFIDKPMVKFMRANTLTTHYAITGCKLYTSTNIVESSFLFHHLRIISQHTAGMDQLTEDTVANAYNFSNQIKPEIFKQSGASGYRVIQFNTSIEKDNFVNFYKTNRNFINRMIANQFMGVRLYDACFPKVDWTKDDWTIEKILKTVANYTDEEVQAVLDTMDKDYTIKDDASIERLFGEYLK